jgi:hypothetical protein
MICAHFTRIIGHFCPLVLDNHNISHVTQSDMFQHITPGRVAGGFGCPPQHTCCSGHCRVGTTQSFLSIDQLMGYYTVPGLPERQPRRLPVSHPEPCTHHHHEFPWTTRSTFLFAVGSTAQPRLLRLYLPGQTVKVRNWTQLCLAAGRADIKVCRTCCTEPVFPMVIAAFTALVLALGHLKNLSFPWCCNMYAICRKWPAQKERSSLESSSSHSAGAEVHGRPAVVARLGLKTSR